MRIGIDARPLIEKKTGIGYYLDYLLTNILKNDSTNEYILFSDRRIYFNAESFKNVKFIVDDKSKMKQSLWYMFKIDKLCKKENIDLFWGTQHVLPLGLKNITKVLTIHDLVAFDFKETMSFYNKLINILFIPRSIKSADKIIAVSKSTEERLLHHFSNYCKGKTTVIYEDVIVNNDYSNINDSYLKDIGIEEKEFIMFLGTIEPRKNIGTLIKALDKINKETNMKLLICGKYGWNYESEKKLIESNKDKIVFLNYISDDEKNYLMNKSFAFIFPSLYEGFGLPILEAMRNNTITLVADNTSLKEIIEDNRLRFDTFNYEELANKVISIYKDKELYKEVYNYCMNRKNDFNWNKISQEYISLFNIVK